MNTVLGLLLLGLGVFLVILGMPKNGVPRAFVRGGFGEMMYPTLCLAILVFGLALLGSGLVW